MRKFIGFFTLLALFLCANSAFCAQPRKITLQQAIDIAVQNNIDYKAAQIDVEIAKNNIKSANKLQPTKINTFFNIGSIARGNPQMLGATQGVEIAKRDARKKLAESNLLLTKENVGYYEFDLKMDVREAYIKLAVSKSILNNLQMQQKLLEELLSIAKKKVAAGETTEMDVLQAEIAINQMVTHVNTARAEVKAALHNFNKVINPQGMTEVEFDAIDSLFDEKDDFDALMTPPPKTKLPLFELIAQKSLSNRYDIRIAKQKIDVAQKNLTLVARQRIPDLEFFGGYGYQTRAMSEEGKFQGGAYAGANITNIPLFYSYKPEIANAKLEIDKAELNYQSAENKALKDLSSAYERFVTAKMNLNDYNEKLLKCSKEMINLSKKNYGAGKSNLTTFIVMEQSYKSIIIEYTKTLAEYYNSWVGFLREVNAENFDIESI